MRYFKNLFEFNRIVNNFFLDLESDKNFSDIKLKIFELLFQGKKFK